MLGKIGTGTRELDRKFESMSVGVALVSDFVHA